MKRLVTLTVLVLLPGIALSAPPTAAIGSGGAVVSAEAASTEVGLEILRRGGNAADAAVATALAMVVVHPQAGNLGGGGFAIVRFGDEITSLDFRETAPARAHPDMYLDPDGKPIPDASTVGPLASGVPGSPAGLEELHRRYGALPWRDVVEPAVRLAEEGFEVSARLEEAIADERDLLARFPETAAIWLPDGSPPSAGTTMKLPDLARTLRTYADKGAAGLSSAEIADRIAETVARYGGILDAADLASYRPEWRPPLEFEALGWSFAAMDLPSSGGYLLAAALQLAERLDWGAAEPGSAERAHLLVEIWRRIFADRVQLGDPASTRVTAQVLLEPRRLDRLAATVDLDRATPSTMVGGWPKLPEKHRASDADETVHLSVIDPQGNVVALTTTLNGTFGCGLSVPGVGLFLNNEMDDFSTAPGQPNMFGLIQGPANEVAAGRRMLSSMVPTIAWKGSEILTLGGRGGSRIPTAVSQVVLGALADGRPLAETVASPRIHHQWLPDSVWMEEGALDPSIVEKLEALGHALELNSRNAKVNAIRLRADGALEAAGDPRGPASGDVLEPLAESRKVAEVAPEDAPRHPCTGPETLDLQMPVFRDPKPGAQSSTPLRSQAPTDC